MRWFDGRLRSTESRGGDLGCSLRRLGDAQTARYPCTTMNVDGEGWERQE